MEGIVDFWTSCAVSNLNLVVGINLIITVNILILDVAGANSREGLDRTCVDFSLVLEESDGLKSVD